MEYKSDILIVVGLGMLGAGLYLWLGLGESLTAVGTTLLLWGYAMSPEEKGQ